ncbi:FdhF/YdeP family oxidoreductase [Reichenbachiella sp. MALMAid0571]|uniref:FdhF/YdeP family oxidoreductase n=1 Tax=Reichenbachiella sp. MALMAid0571 TaxID=3143939 RepID=UPI0032DF02F3
MIRKEENLFIGKPADTAAGNKAVYVALKSILKRVNPFKAFQVLKGLNQKNGVDCPGCAWPDPSHRSNLGEFCENGVKAIAEETMDKNADEAFFSKFTVAELKDKTDYWLGQQGRLTQPMMVRQGESHYASIEWDEAFALVAEKLNALPSPDDAIFYTSGRTSNEAAFLYQLFVRIFGTNNLPDCSNMCHESSGVALSHALGIGKGSVTLEDFEKSELILIFGQNPGTNHPRMLSSLEKAKKNGAKVVSINPLKEPGLIRFKNPQNLSGVLGAGTEITDLYLQVKINEDVALLKAVMISLLERHENGEGCIDLDFINDKTSDFELFKSSLQNESYDALIKRTGLEEKDVATLVDLIAKRKRIIACWAMGLTQHVNAVDNIQEVVNLLLLKGSIGKEGAGTCPVRGHSNVQGDRTMGIWEKPSKEFLNTLADTFNFQPPQNHGVDVVASIEKMTSTKGNVFMGLGGNFLSAAPDTHYTAKALSNCSLTVHVSTKLNRSHLEHGEVGLIFPCLGRTDQIVEKSGVQKLTVENSMGMVHTTEGMLKPRSEYLLSEPKIIAKIASLTVGNDVVDWESLIENYDNIRDLIAKSVKGFEKYNERITNENGFELPNGPRYGVFNTPSGKALFTVNKLPEHVLEENEYLMTTIRSHDQFNTTVYGLDDRYRGIFGARNIVLMNKEDMAVEGFKEQSLVTLYNTYGAKERLVENLKIVPYDIPRGCLATYFPECNALVPLGLKANLSHTPASKSVKVKIRK